MFGRLPRSNQSRLSRKTGSAWGRKRSRPVFDHLEGRQLLSLLSITSGALTYDGSLPGPAASNLTVDTTGGSPNYYTFTDPSQAIFLSAGATIAGWTLVNANEATGLVSSVSSIAIDQASGVTNSLNLTSVLTPTTVNFANSSTNTLDIAATGVAATAPVTVLGTASAALTLGIDAGLTAGTFQTGAAGSIVDVSYQASGSGLISVATADEPSFLGPNFTNLTAGSLAVDLNSLYTSPTALGTFIFASGSNTIFALSENSYAIPTADLGAITVDGTSAGQALQIDFGNGDPLPASGLTYSPAASLGVNSLMLNGGSFTSENYTATGPGAGSITYDGTKTITFSNLSPIFDTVPSPSFTFTAPTGGGQTVDLVNGPIIGGTQTAKIDDGGTGHFEYVDFGNKTAVTVNTPGTGNTVLVNYLIPADGMTSLAVNGLAGNSATTTVQATPSGVPTTVTTSGGGTTSIGPNLTSVLSNVSVSDLTGGAVLNVSDTGDATGQTYTLGGSTITTTATPAVFSYASSVGTVSLTGGSGTNIFNTNESTLVPADTYTVTGGSGFNTMNVSTTSSTVVVTTPGILTFGAGNAAIHYASIQQINISKPTASPAGTGVPFTAVEALPFTADRVATFTTTDLGSPAEDFVASINWGDGTTTSGGAILANGTTSYDVTGGHTYAVAGTYTADVTLTAIGGAGSTTVGTTNITITATGQALSTPNPIVATATVAAAPLSSQGSPVSGVQYVPLAASGAVLVATFEDSGTILPPSDYTAAINWGDGVSTPATSITSQGTPTGTVFSVFGDHNYSIAGSYPISVTIVKPPVTGSTEPAPGATTVALSTATIAPDAAIVAQGAPIAGVQYLALSHASGSPVLIATFTDTSQTQPTSGYSATIAWGDGTTSAASSITEQGTSSGVVFSILGDHTYSTPGSDPVTVTIVKAPLTGSTQPAPGSTAIASSTATIAPDATLVAIGSAVSGLEGLPLSHASGSPVLIATFTDSSQTQPTSGYTATIAWGDGTSSAATSITEQGTSSGVLFSVFGDHTYAAVGSYPITVTIVKAPLPGSTQPAPGSTIVASSTATIADAPLSAANPQPTVSATEGMPFSGAVATFSDLNPAATVAQFHAAIDWGDGSPLSVGVVSLAGGVFTVSDGHTYLQSLPTGTVGTGLPGPQNGTYGLKVYVIDMGGSTLNLNNTAAVADVALTVSGQLDPSSNSSGIAVTPITNIVQPTFIGSASEPYAKITIFAVAVTTAGYGPLTQVGQGHADNIGAWAVTTSTALTDGFYNFYAQGVDQAGQTYSPLAFLGGVTIDTLGPKITGLNFERVQGQISYTIQDYGAYANMGSGVVIASLLDANNYAFTKAHVGRQDFYKVTSITVSPGTDFGAQTVTLTINHGHYLRGGRYYITIKSATDSNTSGVRDLAGNALDGEFYNYFPSGNNVNGGNFAAELNAIHHIIYEPVSTVGTATPVNPPGTLGANTTIPTYNPPKTAHASRFALRHSHHLGTLAFHHKARHDFGGRVGRTTLRGS